MAHTPATLGRAAMRVRLRNEQRQVKVALELGRCPSTDVTLVALASAAADPPTCRLATGELRRRESLGDGLTYVDTDTIHKGPL